MVLEESSGFVSGEVEHFTDVETLVANLARARVEALAAAGAAGRDDIGQEAHFVGDGAHAAADLAAPAARTVEGKSRRAEALDAGVGALGEDLADVIPDAEKRCRHGAGGAPDGRLVDRECAFHVFETQEPVVGAGWRRHEAELLTQRGEQHRAYQRALPRSADAGHDREASDRDFDAYVLQIVLPRAFELDEARVLADGALASQPRRVTECATSR
jgi:hypothetical protein